MLFRQLTAFLLVLVFFSQAFSRCFLFADYYVNTAAYSANCVNKDRPWMHCEGHCQLCKKLNQQEKSEDKQIPDRKSGGERNESPCSVASQIDLAVLQGISAAIRKYPEVTADKPTHMPRDLFHPPGGHLA